MDIYKDIEDVKKERCVIALGNFDGVHLGHRLLISKASKLALSSGTLAGVYTFAVNSKVLLGVQDLGLLTTEEEKNRIFSELGADYVCYDDFDKVKNLSAEEFCRYLYDKTGCKTVICGDNFRFGKGACASSTDLARIMAGHNVSCEIIPLKKAEQTGISSTEIRSLIKGGDVDKAAKLLGYRYFIESEVIHGARLGRTLGFPTINQHIYGGKIVPSYGVYLCVCSFDGKSFPGIVNVGVKPTVSGNASNPEEVFETHILGYSGDLYGKKVKLEFCEKIRDEIKFSSLDELKKTVLCDIETARDYFGKESNIQ